jgi:hypothetical protein
MNVFTAAEAPQGEKMTTFLIEEETNNITVQMKPVNVDLVTKAETFRNEAEFTILTEKWPSARLVEVWNSLPGVSPVRKFTDRKTAVSRIWKAIQGFAESLPAEFTSGHPGQSPDEAGAQQPTDEPALAPMTEAVPESPDMPAPDTTGAPQSPDVAREGAPAPTQPSRAKREPKTATTGSVAREGSKTSLVIAMLRREGGTTLEEIMASMGWQKHTTRAMLSAGGSLTKKHGLVIISEKVADKRTYSIKA